MTQNISPALNTLASLGDTNLTCVDHDALRIPLALLYSVIFILGLVGNVVALCVFFYVQSKKTSVRVFLINVAFADLLLVAGLPFRMYYHIHGNIWTLDPTLCKVVGILFYTNMYTSVTLLGMISVDRYVKFHGRVGTRQRIKSTKWSTTLCAVIWIVSFAVFLVLLLSKSEPSQSYRCFHYRQLLRDKWKAYINVSVVALFWLVFIALVASYGRIALSLLHISKEKPDLPNTLRYIRTAKKSFFILFIFTVCFVPYHVIRIFYIWTQVTDTLCYWKNVADKANEVALLFSALNSCLDPIMYFLLSSSVRTEVLRAVRRVFLMKDISGASSNSSTAELDARSGREVRGQPKVSWLGNSPNGSETPDNG